MGEKKISEGDTVDIHWENLMAEFGVKILYTPCQTGDSFTAEREDGTILNVQNYCKMVKVS